MSVKLIRNRDAFNCILEYDTSIGPLKEISAASVAEDDICKLANYIKIDGKYYGIYATANGPRFFYQNEEFPLNSLDSVLQHTKGDEKHHFKFIYKQREVIDLDYDHWADLDIDPWSEEDFIDFFIWLTKSSSNQEFIQMWSE